MVTLSAHLGQVLSLLIGIIGLIAVTTWLLKRRRRDVWQRLASARNLQFSDHPDGPRVQGTAQGRVIEVTTDDHSSDRDVGGVEVVQISVGIHGVPNSMTAEGTPGLIGNLTVLAEERINFEQKEFSQDVLVQGNENHARQYWTDQRIEAFLRIVRTALCDQVYIRDGQLTAVLREVVSDQERLEQLLDQLLEAAIVLDNNLALKETGT
ncbi:MAG: hypothetical protein KDA52_04800 [Planctomycetaceae bacterium]|nr:hypothetical protein [Planctomycetaceae bacterium]